MSIGSNGESAPGPSDVTPYYHIHPKCLSDGQQRAHFHRIVYELAEPHPRITIRTQCRVVAMEPSLPTLTLESGELADLVIGADGVRSLFRQTNPNLMGDTAYRAIIPTDVLLNDPDLCSLVETPEMVGWMGPGRHIMAYSIVRHAYLHVSIPTQHVFSPSNDASHLAR